MSPRDNRAPSAGTADAALTEAQNGSARERDTAVYKSWMPPISLSGRCSRRRPIKAHEIPSRAPGFYQPGVVAPLTRSHGAHGFQEQERVRGVRVEAEPR